MVKTCNDRSQACLCLVRQPAVQTPAEASSEASLKIQRPQGTGRPCYEAAIPLAVENSVGKPAASRAPNVGPGKRAWRTPKPQSDLRGKRSDPWHRANVPTQSGAVPELNGKDAEQKITSVSLPGS